MNKSLLIIGKSFSSKTVFITQFHTRLQKGKSRLTLYKPVTNLSAITQSKAALADGKEPEPTNPEKSVDVEFPIQFGERQIDLLCPDYGGEQVMQIITKRIVNDKWKQAIEKSDNWIFFVRVHNNSKSQDITQVTITKAHVNKEEKSAGNETEVFKLSDQSSLIELLQILLSVKKYDYHRQNQHLKLTVALTCWDELQTTKTPPDILKEHLPLLYSFIQSNWIAERINIIGLSALGFPLNTQENKEKYQYEGAHKFGFLIKQNGERTEDITELVAEAL